MNKFAPPRGPLISQSKIDALRPKHLDLTPDVIRSLCYFILEKGDIARCCYWERPEIRAQMRAKHPELLDALERQTSANRTVRILAESIESPLSDE